MHCHRFKFRKPKRAWKGLSFLFLVFQTKNTFKSRSESPNKKRILVDRSRWISVPRLPKQRLPPFKNNNARRYSTVPSFLKQKKGKCGAQSFGRAWKERWRNKKDDRIWYIPDENLTNFGNFLLYCKVGTPKPVTHLFYPDQIIFFLAFTEALYCVYSCTPNPNDCFGMGKQVFLSSAACPPTGKPKWNFLKDRWGS